MCLAGIDRLRAPLVNKCRVSGHELSTCTTSPQVEVQTLTVDFAILVSSRQRLVDSQLQ